MLDIGRREGRVGGFEFAEFAGPVAYRLTGDAQFVCAAYRQVIFVSHGCWTPDSVQPRAVVTVTFALEWLYFTNLAGLGRGRPPWNFPTLGPSVRLALSSVHPSLACIQALATSLRRDPPRTGVSLVNSSRGR